MSVPVPMMDSLKMVRLLTCTMDYLPEILNL